MTIDDTLRLKGLAYVMTDVVAGENLFIFGDELYRLPTGAVDTTHIKVAGRKREVYVAKIEDVLAAVTRTLH